MSAQPSAPVQVDGRAAEERLEARRRERAARAAAAAASQRFAERTLGREPRK